jgi:branched-chain amino acid transport system substrate-binding protein
MSKLNKIILWVIAIVIVIALIWLGYSEKQPVIEGRTIKIGAINPMSGTLAVYGMEYVRGIEMAVEKINQEGGINGKLIEVIYEDDEGSAKKSVDSIHRLIDIENISIILTSMSSPTQATAPIAEEKKVIMISATASKFGDLGEYIFRDYWDMEKLGKTSAEVLNKENIKKVGIIAVNWADYSQFMNGFNEVINEDVEIKEERFNLGDIDFKTQLTKIKSFNPDSILLYSFPGNEIIKIVSQIFELGMSDKLILDGPTGLGWRFVSQALDPLLKQMKVIANWYSLDKEKIIVQEFIKEYEDKYQQELNGDAAYTYDDIFALKIALENCDKEGKISDTNCIKDELLKVEYEGVAGILKFDSKGNSMRDSYLQTYTENGWEKYILE